MPYKTKCSEIAPNQTADGPVTASTNSTPEQKEVSFSLGTENMLAVTEDGDAIFRLRCLDDGSEWLLVMETAVFQKCISLYIDLRSKVSNDNYLYEGYQTLLSEEEMGQIDRFMRRRLVDYPGGIRVSRIINVSQIVVIDEELHDQLQTSATLCQVQSAPPTIH